MASGYRVFKVPPRGRESIVVQASQLVQRHYPNHWREPQPVPVADFLERHLAHYKIDYGVVAALSVGEEGKIVGVGSEGRPEILIPEPVMLGLYDDKPRPRFTTAHELGHGILHGKYITAALSENRSPQLFRREDLKAYEDPEWQANVFAGAFLMPTRALAAHIQRWGAEPSAVADAFNVSFQAAQTRMAYMGR